MKMDTSRPLSWTSLSLFNCEYSADGKKEWYKKYILREPTRETPEMVFGKLIADSFQTKKPLAPVTRYDTMEHKLSGTFGGIPLVGYMDTFDTKTKRRFREYKTGAKAWDQKRADKHGQIDMYLFMIYLLYGIKPEDVTVHLDWVPTVRTEDGTFDVAIKFVEPIKVHSFETHRTSEQVLLFASSLKKTWAEMQRFAEEYDP